MGNRGRISVVLSGEGAARRSMMVHDQRQDHPEHLDGFARHDRHGEPLHPDRGGQISRRQRTSIKWDDPYNTLQPSGGSRPMQMRADSDRINHHRFGRFRQSRNRRTRLAEWLGGIRLKVLLIVSSAVLVGTVMGLIVLSVFSDLGQEHENGPGSSAVDQNEVSNGEGLVDWNDSARDGETGQSQGQDENPVLDPDKEQASASRSYFAVQAGAFEDEQAAQALLASFQESGYAGLLLQENEQYRLYMGISPVRENIDPLADYLERNGIETYVREHAVVSPPQAGDQDGSLRTYHELLAAGDVLLSGLTGFAAGALNAAGSATLDDEQWGRLQQQHMQVLEKGEVLLTAWQDEPHTLIERMLHHLSTAMEALQAYRQQPNASYLWQMHLAGLHYVQASQQLGHFLKQS